MKLLASTIVWYALCSFIAWEVNFTMWSWIGRATFVFLIASSYSYITLKDKVNGKEK
jgi:hypothetical protein